MRTLEELKDKLKQYIGVDYLYYPEQGLITWRYSTGENIEILHIQSEVRGFGKVLCKRMADAILSRNERPYHSVFVFRLKSNLVAEKFYRKLGWKEVDLGDSIYGGDDTVIMWITWEDLLKRLGANDEND